MPDKVIKDDNGNEWVIGVPQVMLNPTNMPKMGEVERVSETGARKADVGKLRYDLLPPDAIREVARVYTIGARKYADRNWEKGMEYSRLIGALKRHLNAWEAGEEYDPTDGQHHLASVAWCALGLLAYCLRRIGTDDRNKIAVEGKPFNE